MEQISAAKRTEVLILIIFLIRFLLKISNPAKFENRAGLGNAPIS
ncbi:hypothetical protein NC99_07980 [Sunxiuqinia dokdonensis]|uniref:Uncharacterized protein n=1 Tax=Sunxiuqinia dokdonensis TaxID=1409788 RepID=A0A0L8VDV3_9BACT|nr:hypothetical protein NC99_07980 [Sunxiuqinia dokdonensis]